jgi:hypothetical protein
VPLLFTMKPDDLKDRLPVFDLLGCLMLYTQSAVFLVCISHASIVVTFL